MRKILLVIPILFLAIALHSQVVSKQAATPVAKTTTSKSTLNIFPNPATNFIKIKSVKGVSAVIIYNLIGRKIKQYKAEKGKAYSITELPKGMYLVQFLGLDGKALATQRLSKR